MRALVPHDPDTAAIIERVLLAGDLARLMPEERVRYYQETCRSLGLNPLTRPFEYITLNGKLTLYATRGATDQLRYLRQISVEIVGRAQQGDVYVVTARGTEGTGARARHDESTGAVSIAALQGDALANALMKAETKAKRRVTLSIVGLGWLDESELETIPLAVTVGADEAALVAPEPVPAPRELAPFVPRPRLGTASEFWAAAHALLGCSRSAVASRVAHLLGEEAAAFKAREHLTWSQLYDVVVAQAGEPPPPEDEDEARPKE